MSTKGQNYFANMVKAPQILQGSPNYDIEVSDGQTPPGEFYPASYLPTVLSENIMAGSAYVLMGGKVVSYDRNKRLIPAGLAMDYVLYKEAFDADITANAVDADAPTAAEITTAHAAAVTARGSNLKKYTTRDEEFGVVGLDGNMVQADDVVAESMLNNLDTFTAGQNAVTDPVGIIRYSKLMAPGTNPSDPTTFTKHAYDTGGAAAYSRWCYVQVPVVEVNVRREPTVEGDTKHRIRLYADESGVSITDADGVAITHDYGDGLGAVPIKQLHTLTDIATVEGDPTYFALVGRTLLFNGIIPADWYVNYTPKVDLPFTCLKMTDSSVVGTDSAILDANAAFIGEEVGFDLNSDFALASGITPNGYNRKVGRILDLKNGSNDDLKLVRTYFRDYGLWQEQPGSATDGRNTQLSIINAPKWIVRIAVNFESNFSVIA